MADQLTLQGTLDALVLKALSWGPQHGHAVARMIHAATDGTFEVLDGSLYAALHRLEERDWVESEWGLSDKGKQARFYRLTSRAGNSCVPSPCAGTVTQRLCLRCSARPFSPRKVSTRPRYRDFLRANPRRELEDELRFHIETEIEDLVARGMSAADARQQALAKFGDIDRYMTECGESDRKRRNRGRRTRVMDALRQDVRFALRGFARRPVFAVSAALVLALGVGANAAVLSVVDHIFLRPPAVVESPGALRRLFVERKRENASTYFQVRSSYPEARIVDSTISAAFPSAIYFRQRASIGVDAAAPRSGMAGWCRGGGRARGR